MLKEITNVGEMSNHDCLRKKKKHEDEFQTVNHLIQRPKGMSK